MPDAVLFPANKPSSRADAQVLDQWVSKSFASYAQRSKDKVPVEDLTKAVEELVPVLSIGLNEIVRQVSQHCLERGLVLEKIWRTYVELFERALAESREALHRQKERTAKYEVQLAHINNELEDLKAKHPAQLEKLSQTLTGKFTQRQQELQTQLSNIRGESRALKLHLDEQTQKLGNWFPLFPKYKDSVLRKNLFNRPGVTQLATAAELKLAADIRRILEAVPPDVRRRIGFFISSLLGYRGSALSASTAEVLQERKATNVTKLAELEEKLRKLKAEEAEKNPKNAQTRQGTVENSAAEKAKADTPEAKADTASEESDG